MQNDSGVGGHAFFFDAHYPLLTTHYPPSFQTLAHFFALRKILTLLFSDASALCVKKHACVEGHDPAPETANR